MIRRGTVHLELQRPMPSVPFLFGQGQAWRPFFVVLGLCPAFVVGNESIGARKREMKSSDGAKEPESVKKSKKEGQGSKMKEIFRLALGDFIGLP
jgi:hypothetical protein